MITTPNRIVRSAVDLGPGVLCCLVIGALSYLSNAYLLNKMSPLLWAFVYSILITNLIKLPGGLDGGINFCSSTLLRVAIVVFGFTISVMTWTKIGIIGLAQVMLVVGFALSFGFWIGRLLGIGKAMAILIAVGTSICGASAIAAMGPAIKARNEEMGVALACITLFGLVAMVAYPFIFLFTGLGNWLDHSQAAFGVWAGTGIHETAQVIAAAAQVSKEAADVALVTKSVRIFMIAPVVLVASVIFAQSRYDSGTGRRAGMPLFAVAFVLATLFNSVLLYLPVTNVFWSPIAASLLKPLSIFLLATAFAGIGYKVRYEAIRTIGLKAFAVGLLVALATSVVAFLLVIFLYIPFSSAGLEY